MPDDQDRDFARRLAVKDPRVLFDIDAAYSRHLRGRLMKHCGSGFTEDDVKSIVQDSLQVVWQRFDPNRGASVRAFYFGVAGRKRLARLKEIGREVFRAENGCELAELAICESRGPDQRVTDAESAREEIELAPALRLLLDRAFKLLTPRQRRAFEYYCQQPGYGWAKSLAKELGGTPRAWRKAKREATMKIAPFLELHGVRFSREEGRFELA